MKVYLHLIVKVINPLNAELNPICHLLTLLGAHPIYHISRTRVKKMQIYKLIYYSKSALHVSGGVFAHHQEHLTVLTVSGSDHPSCCWLVSWMSWNCVSNESFKLYLWSLNPMHLSATLEVILVREIVGSSEYLCSQYKKTTNFI